MRTVLALVKKEFIQVLRDHNMLRLIFLMPLIQLLILGYAINIDVKEIDTAVYDYDQSRLSRDYVRSFAAGDYFIPEKPDDIELMDLEQGFTTNRYRAALIIPEDFSENIENGKRAEVAMVFDGTNANSAGIAMGYSGLVTQQFALRESGYKPSVEMRRKILYNPDMESVYFMIPGIVVTLLTMLTSMATAMAIVREREMGTLEQLMVTPMSTPALILGKTIPFAILGYVEMSLALAFGIFWFNIPFVGSWTLLYALAFIYLLTTLGAGMFISTVTSTQQQAMFFAWFFMVFSLLTSGFFTPIENMPEVVQHLTLLNPQRFFMTIMRGIMMKDSGIAELYPQILALVIFSVVIFSFSWMRLSKRVK